MLEGHYPTTSARLLMFFTRSHIHDTFCDNLSWLIIRMSWRLCTKDIRKSAI